VQSAANPDKIAEPWRGEFVSIQPSTAKLPASWQELIERIARLDEEFAAGRVAEPEYSAQRAAWKSEAMQQVMEQSLQTSHSVDN
jgi:hypothetical protein